MKADAYYAGLFLSGGFVESAPGIDIPGDPFATSLFRRHGQR